MSRDAGGLAQLAVLAAAPVVAAGVHLRFVMSGLAGDAQAYPRDGLAACLGNGAVAFLAMAQAVTARQTAARALHGVFDAGIYLLLYRSVLCPSTGHVVLSESAVASRSIVTVIDFMPWRRVPIKFAPAVRFSPP